MGFRKNICLAAGPAMLCFVIVMERPASVTVGALSDRFGWRVEEEDVELRCLCCANLRQSRVLDWRVMGEEGRRILRYSDSASVFSSDFPEFSCGHYWIPRNEESLAPALCGPAWGFGGKYSEDGFLRERVQEELSEGRLDRESVIKRVEGEWFDDQSPGQAILDEIEYGPPPPVFDPLPLSVSEPLVTGLRPR